MKKIILFVFVMFYIFVFSYIYSENKSSSIMISAGYHLFPDSDELDYYDNYFERRNVSETSNLPGVNLEIGYNSNNKLITKKFGFEIGWYAGTYNGSLEHSTWYDWPPDKLQRDKLYSKVFYFKIMPKIFYNINNKIKPFLGLGGGIYSFYLRYVYDQKDKTTGFPWGNSYSTDDDDIAMDLFKTALNYTLGAEYKISDRFGLLLYDNYVTIPVVYSNEKMDFGGNSIMLGIKTYF